MQVDILSALIKIGANCLLPGSPEAYAAGKKFVKYIWPIIKKLKGSVDNVEALQGEIEERQIYVEGGISLKLTVGAQLGCAGTWKKSYGEPEGTVPPNGDKISAGSAGVSATMDMLLEGKAFVKSRFFKVEGEAGIIVAAGSAKNEVGPAKIDFKADAIFKNGKPAISGGVEWTGLAILFSSYGKVAMKSDDSADKQTGKTSSGSRPESVISFSESFTKNYFCHYFLFMFIR